MFVRQICVLCLSIMLVACGSSEEPTHVWEQAPNGLFSADLSHDGNYALVAAISDYSGLWELSSHNLLYSWNQGKEYNDIYHTALAYNHEYALTSSYRNMVLWSIRSGDSKAYWRMPSRINAIALSANGKVALVGMNSSRAELVDVHNGRTVQVYRHKQPINAVAIANNGRFVVTGSDDTHAVVWDIVTGKPIYAFDHDSQVNLTEFSPDSQYVITANQRDQAVIWDMRTGQSTHAIGGPYTTVTAARFSKDSKYVAIGTLTGKVELYRVADGKLLKSWQLPRPRMWRPTSATVLAVAFSIDGEHLVTESTDGYAYEWLLPAPPRKVSE